MGECKGIISQSALMEPAPYLRHWWYWYILPAWVYRRQYPNDDHSDNRDWLEYLVGSDCIFLIRYLRASHVWLSWYDQLATHHLHGHRHRGQSIESELHSQYLLAYFSREFQLYSLRGGVGKWWWGSISWERIIDSCDRDLDRVTVNRLGCQWLLKWEDCSP